MCARPITGDYIASTVAAAALCAVSTMKTPFGRSLTLQSSTRDAAAMVELLRTCRPAAVTMRMRRASAQFNVSRPVEAVYFAVSLHGPMRQTPS